MNDHPVELAIAGAILLLFSLIIASGVLESRVQRFCLSKGYPAAEWRLIGPNYCIRRVDQTDQVVSVDSLRAQR